MSKHTTYDKVISLLQQSFQNHINIKEAKQYSLIHLTQLLENEPDSENEVRLGILHFYNQCGLGCFILYEKKGEKKELQIITRIKNRTHNIYTQRIGNFLHTHKPTLYTDEPKKSDFDELFAFVDENLDLSTSATKREMIRAALRNVFRIHTRDGLFFKDGSIKLFKFDYEIVRLNNEIRQISGSAHINVLSNGDRQTLERILLSSNIQNIIVQNTLQILTRDIALSRIDPLSFNKQFSFFSIQKLRIYMETLQIHSIDSLAKSIYCMELLQKYAWIMYEVVAKELLDLCAEHNDNALQFVGFYNGGSITLGTRTMKKPLITDNNGNPWTLPLIKEALHNKRNIEFDIAQMQKRSDNLEEQIQNNHAQIAQNEVQLTESTHKELRYQKDLDSKNKELRALADKQGERDSVMALSEEIKMLIANKSESINQKETAQKTLTQLRQEQITLLEQQTKLKEHISYALKHNKDKFLQYDLLSRALADAIRNAKDLM